MSYAEKGFILSAHLPLPLISPQALRILTLLFVAIGKDSDAGKDWWQEEKGTTEDEMAGWHH